MNVFIEGDKNGFNSKIAVDKLKAYVKKNIDFNIDEVNQRYVKSDYSLSLVAKSDTDIKFNINKKEEETDKTKLLKMKLKNMRDNRTNAELHKAKSKDVPEDIMKEYLRLKRGLNVPIPDPAEILSKPDQYKPMIASILANDMVKQHAHGNPLVRYFKLLANKLEMNLDTPSVSQENYSELLNNEVANVKGNDISADYETDSETNTDSDH